MPSAAIVVTIFFMLFTLFSFRFSSSSSLYFTSAITYYFDADFFLSLIFYFRLSSLLYFMSSFNILFIRQQILFRRVISRRLVVCTCQRFLTLRGGY